MLDYLVLRWDSIRLFKQLRIMMAQRSGSIINISPVQAVNLHTRPPGAPMGARKDERIQSGWPTLESTDHRGQD
jgi:hypothetical protein